MKNVLEGKDFSTIDKEDMEAALSDAIKDYNEAIEVIESINLQSPELCTQYYLGLQDVSAINDTFRVVEIARKQILLAQNAVIGLRALLGYDVEEENEPTPEETE